MKATLDEFKRTLRDVKSFIEVNRAIEAHLATLDASTRESKRLTVDPITKRQLDYHAVVISLYGGLERFVENLTAEYLNTMSSIVKFSELPEKVRKNHLPFSAELVGKTDQKKFSQTSPEQIVRNLYSCILDRKFYKVNTQAFVQQSSNYDHDAINSLFARVGIETASGRTRHRDPLKKWFEQSAQISVGHEIPEGQIKSRLEDLVQRRNDIAHGSISDILEHSLLREKADFLECYGESLFEIVYGEILKTRISNGTVIKLGSAIRVIRNSIICIHVKGIRLREGSSIVAMNPDGVVRWGTVSQVQHDKKRLKRVSRNQELDLGIEVTFHAKDNQVFYLLP